MRVVAVLAAASVGCLSTPDPGAGVDAPGDPCPDRDGDGWPAGAGCGIYVDCEPDDPLRHPGAREDGVGADLDCDDATPGGGELLQPIALARVGPAGSETGFQLVTQSARYDLVGSLGFQLGRVEVDGTALLYTDTDNGERYSGVHVWDQSFSIAATSATQVVAVAGRGVFRIDIAWAHGVMTGGHSTYTITADGRIVRTDAFDVTGTVGLSVTDYVALDASRFSHVYWRDEAGAVDDVPIVQPATGSTRLVGNTTGGDGFLCARSPGNREVGFAVAAPAGGRGLRATTGDTVAGGQDAQVALQYDWSFGVTAVAHLAHTLIWAGGSAGSNGCLESAARARPFQHPFAIGFDGAGTLGAEPGDLGGDGFVEGGGYFALVGAGGALRFHVQGGGGRVPSANYLFRITGLPADADPVIVQGGVRKVHGVDYFLDRAGGAMWLYTQRALGADVIELITPAASCPTCGR